MGVTGRQGAELPDHSEPTPRVSVCSSSDLSPCFTSRSSLPTFKSIASFKSCAEITLPGSPFLDACSAHSVYFEEKELAGERRPGFCARRWRRCLAPANHE